MGSADGLAPVRETRGVGIGLDAHRLPPSSRARGVHQAARRVERGHLPLLAQETLRSMKSMRTRSLRSGGKESFLGSDPPAHYRLRGGARLLPMPRVCLQSALRTSEGTRRPHRLEAMKCPTDGTTLLMSERNSIEIDYCPECRGIWLDRGELDKILDAVKADAPVGRAVPQQPAQRQYRDEPRYEDRRDSRYGDARYQKKKKSPFEFLGDIFEG